MSFEFWVLKKWLMNYLAEDSDFFLTHRKQFKRTKSQKLLNQQDKIQTILSVLFSKTIY